MNETKRKIIELQFGQEQLREARASRIAKVVGTVSLRLGLVSGFLINFFRWILVEPYPWAACIVLWVLSVIVYLRLYANLKEHCISESLARLEEPGRIKLGILLICTPWIGLICSLLLRELIH